jgi:hypothetical protein
LPGLRLRRNPETLAVAESPRGGFRHPLRGRGDSWIVDGEGTPHGAYAAIAAAFAGMLAAAGALARALERDPQCQTTLDLVVLSAATFKSARTIARDEVTSFLRQPFVQGEAHTGEDEEPVQGGAAQAIGELVTCPRCAGTWAAAGLASVQILAPRFGRLLTWSLGAAGINDLLQSGFAVLREKAHELDRRAAS